MSHMGIGLNVIAQEHFTEIHRSLLRKIEKILNRPITKFYNSDDVNTTTAELRQTKTRPISF